MDTCDLPMLIANRNARLGVASSQLAMGCWTPEFYTERIMAIETEYREGLKAMSASFCWEVIKPTRAKTFTHGTSSDCEALESTFHGDVSTKDLPVLRAMHRATHNKESLWNDIANALERLQGEDYAHDVSIKVWVEY